MEALPTPLQGPEEQGHGEPETESDESDKEAAPTEDDVPDERSSATEVEDQGDPISREELFVNEEKSKMALYLSLAIKHCI